MSRPDLSRVPSFYHNYVNLASGDDLNLLLDQHREGCHAFFDAIPEERWDYRYAEGKWSIKELVQHLIDAERIFGYRALRFARKDATPLPGFDENIYAPASKADRRTKSNLLEEMIIVNASSAVLFGSFEEEMLESEGTANGHSISVRAIGFVIVGHALHHAKVIRERYLKSVES